MKERSLMAKGKVSYDFEEYRNRKVLKNQKIQNEIENAKSDVNHPLNMCEVAQEYIKYKCGDISSAILNMRKMRFKAFQTFELVGELRATCLEDWENSPAYYTALTLEIQERYFPPS